MRDVIYEFRLRGRLGQTMLRAFPGLRPETDGEETVLTGLVLDQAALHGVLAEVEALGLELVAVRRVREDAAPVTQNAREEAS